MRDRPRLFFVSWAGGTAHFHVPSTCCPHYRTCQNPQPDSDGYCTTWPLRTDASRTGRLRAHLAADFA